MIDIRALRDDPDGVKAALARRGCRRGRGGRRRRVRRGAPGQGGEGRGDAGRGEGALPPGGARRRRTATTPGPPSSARAAAPSARRSERRPQRPTRSGTRCTPGCSTCPTSRPRTHRTARARRTTSRSAAGGRGRTSGGRSRDGSIISRCRTGRSARRCSSSTWSAGRGWPAPCSRSTAGRGRACSARSPPSPSTATLRTTRRSARRQWCSPTP